MDHNVAQSDLAGCRNISDSGNIALTVALALLSFFA
jgi:hypothetical protein